jgi:hypothetical protein
MTSKVAATAVHRLSVAELVAASLLTLQHFRFNLLFFLLKKCFLITSKLSIRSLHPPFGNRQNLVNV